MIVGGGQGGIALGARLRQLGVPTIIVERNARPGDSWRKRYKSLCLHDPVWYDHLPYLKFPENWPVFSPKDKIGDWLEMYTRVMELNYWSSTTAKSARYDEAAGEWVVVVERDGEEITLRPEAARDGDRHVRQAERAADPRHGRVRAATSTTPRSTRGPTPTRARSAVVIGSNNSAHDICAALWENGADVTMVQRSSTHIVRSATLMDIGLGGALLRGGGRERGHDGEGGHDLRLAPLPDPARVPDPALRRRCASATPTSTTRLEEAGFQLDWGEDGSGLFMKYLRRGSGYYIDVGASELVAERRHQAPERAASTT